MLEAELAREPDPDGAYLIRVEKSGVTIVTPQGNEQWFSTPEKARGYIKWHASLAGVEPRIKADTKMPKLTEVFLAEGKTCPSCEEGNHHRCRDEGCDCCGGTTVREGREDIPDESANAHLPDPDQEGEEFVKIAPIHAVQMTEPFEVETLEGTMPGKEGDWLAKGHNGDMWVVDDEMFRDTYRPVGEMGDSDVPKLESVFRVREAVNTITSKPPPGSAPVKPTEWTAMGAVGQNLKKGLDGMKQAGQEMNVYDTPDGQRLAYPKDSAPGRGPMRADPTKGGIWAPVTGSSATGTPSGTASPTTM